MLGNNTLLFDQIKDQEGLSYHISFIYEDQLGFIWFGNGPEGLGKYNGYEIEYFNFNPDDTTSLPHNLVQKILHEDRSGNLWMLTGGHLTRYNRASNDFSRFHSEEKKFDPDNWWYIGSVTEDLDGNIWLGSYGNPENPSSGGLFRFHPESNRFTLYQHDPEDSSSLFSNSVTQVHADGSGDLWVGMADRVVDRLKIGPDNPSAMFLHYVLPAVSGKDSPQCSINRILEDGHGNLWFGTWCEGLLKYKRESDKLVRYWIDTDPESTLNRITLLSQDSKGDLWVGTKNGIATYNRKSDQFQTFSQDPRNPGSLSDGPVNSLVHGKDGYVWMITGRLPSVTGIIRFNPQTGQFKLFSHEPGMPHSLPSNHLISSLVDQRGILWIASSDRGLFKCDPMLHKFKPVVNSPTNPGSSVPDGIQSILVDNKNQLWFGTQNQGLCRFDRNKGSLTSFTHLPGDPGSISSNNVYSILEGPEDILWIGCDSGLNRLDTRSMSFTHYWPDPEKLSYIGPNYIRDLCLGDSGKIWLATMGGGLICFNPADETFVSHLRKSPGTAGVQSERLLCVLVDNTGIVWVGSLGGLHKYQPGTGNRLGKNVSYHYAAHDPYSLGSNMVGDLAQDQEGMIWIGTGGGGLNRLHPDSGRFKRFTRLDGFASNLITGIQIDNNGSIWYKSLREFGHFNPRSGKCLSYGSADGLSSFGIFKESIFQSPDREIFFSASGAIYSLHADSLLVNTSIPKVILTHFHLDNKDKKSSKNLPLKEHISYTKRIELSYDENFITFEFLALNFTNSHKNQYRYRMIGIDPDTVMAGTRRSATYTAIRPGKYTFWMTGSNNDGVWNPEGTSLEIIIHPPWHRSKLALFVYLLLLISGILGIIRWRTWKLLKDRRELEQLVRIRTKDIEEKDKRILEMDRIKTRFFANISHEFRTPLSLIISPLEEIISQRSNGDPELKRFKIMRRNGKRLLDLVNQLLDLSKLDSGKLKIELGEADVTGFLNLICANFISMAEKNDIRYHCHLPDQAHIVFFDAQKLETILNNLLSNAFKFTPNGGEIECKIRIESSGSANKSNKLIIAVTDSGPGIEAEKLDAIFDRFYQEEGNGQENGRGTGIGLSLTRELVELIHGSIRVESKVGEGSSFFLTIPLGMKHLKESDYILKEAGDLIKDGKSEHTDADPYEDAPDEELRERDKRQEANSMQILIVEDNIDLRSYLKERLSCDYTIETAFSGEEGLKKALKNIPDLIISDVMMPGMDGIELCKRLKASTQTSHIPVILLTARADFESKIEGLVTGADDYIFKPFHIREIKTRINNLISLRNLLKERFSRGLHSSLEDISLYSYDVKFINHVSSVVETHLSDLDFDVKDLQAHTGLSHSQLYRKLNALTGYSPSRYIRLLRLKKAASLLEQKNGSVTQVALEVGFGNISYFTKCFREEYGITPSEFTRQFV